ncbi:MAG TPA: hypothetical protein VMS88_02765, partial [Terriglobales bacterium]|nr:hypothetical protein [Terriglobales bacterium]
MVPPLVLTLLLVAHPAAPISTATPPTHITDEALTSKVRARLDSLARADAFSGAVLVAHGDRVLLREARGPADRESHIENRPETRFNLGSIN